MTPRWNRAGTPEETGDGGAVISTDMIGRFYLAVLLPAALLLAAHPLHLHAQRRQPVPSDEKQWDLIEKGHRFQDDQDFDAAIEIYLAVLKLNPDNVDAMFDLASSYYDTGEFRQSLEISRRGTGYESDHLGYFYLMLGTNYDILNEPRKAVDAYRDGIAVDPGSYLLHYNLGVTYLNMKRPADARESFKRALTLNPNHASSHIGLGQIYFRQGDRVPALMALGRAAILDPQSGRAEVAAALIADVLRPAPGGRGSGDREGNFVAVDALLATDSGLAGEPWTGELEQTVSRLRIVLGRLRQLDASELGSSFAATYYAPYFVQLADHGFVEAFAYHIQQSRGGTEVMRWVTGNAALLEDFLEWSGGFRWGGRRQE